MFEPEPKPMPVSTTALTDLVTAAHAVAFGDRHPCRLVHSRGRIDVYARSVDALDTLAAGAAALDIRTVMNANGWAASIHLWPEPSVPLLAARVRIGSGCLPPPGAELLYAGLARRTREPLARYDDSSWVMGQLATAASAEGGHLRGLARSEQHRLGGIAESYIRPILLCSWGDEHAAWVRLGIVFEHARLIARAYGLELLPADESVQARAEQAHLVEDTPELRARNLITVVRPFAAPLGIADLPEQLTRPVEVGLAPVQAYRR